MLCICDLGRQLREEVLDMFLDYGFVGADVRGGESSANDFAAAITMLSMCASGKDV